MTSAKATKILTALVLMSSVAQAATTHEQALLAVAADRYEADCPGTLTELFKSRRDRLVNRTLPGKVVEAANKGVDTIIAKVGRDEYCRFINLKINWDGQP